MGIIKTSKSINPLSHHTFKNCRIQRTIELSKKFQPGLILIQNFVLLKFEQILQVNYYLISFISFMEEVLEHYLFKFRLLISDIFIAGCPDGAIHLLWKTPNAIFVYDQFKLQSSGGYALINNDIEIEEILTKMPDQSFSPVETQLLALSVNNQIKRPIASLKIDLAALAQAQILNCIKKFEIDSFLNQEAWIGFGVSQISSIKVTWEEVVNFRYARPDQQLTTNHEIREAISHVNTQTNDERQHSNGFNQNKKKKRQRFYKRLMRLLEGKNELIATLEQKIGYLIQGLKTFQVRKLNSPQTHHSPKLLIDTETRIKPTARTSSTGSQTDRKNLQSKSLKRQDQEQNADYNNILEENSSLKLKIDQLKIRQLQQKAKIMEFQKDRAQFQRQADKKRLFEEELKEYREALFNQKKNNILIKQDNERLLQEVKKLGIENREMINRHQLSFRDGKQFFAQTPMSHSRRITQMTEDKKLEMDQKLKVRSSELQSEVVVLKQQIHVLKRKLIENQEYSQKLFDKEAVGVEQKIRMKIQEYKNKLIQESQSHAEEIIKLQKQLEQQKVQATTAIKEKSNFQKQVDMLKNLHQRSEERRVMTDSSFIKNQKYKRRCAELQQMTKKLQGKIQKQDEELKKKKITIQDLNQKFNQKQAELNRLQRLQSDYQKHIDKVASLQSIQTNNRKLNVELSNIEYRKTVIQDKIKHLAEQLKGLHANLNELANDSNSTQVQNIEKEIRSREELMKTHQQELSIAQSQLMKLKTDMISSQNMGQLDLVNLRLQQLNQQNQDLKSILRELVKRTALGINDIDPKDNLMDVQIRQKDLGVKEQQFNFSVEEMMGQFENIENITFETMKAWWQKCRKMFDDRLKELKDQITKVYHRELDLSLRQKRVVTSQNRLEILQILKKLLSLLDIPVTGALRRRSHTTQDTPREQSLDYVRRQKQWELKLLEEKEKARLDRRKNDDIIQQFQSKLRNERRGFNVELKEALDKQKTQYIAIYQKRLVDKERQMTQINSDISNRKVFFDEQNNTSVSNTLKLQQQVDTLANKIKQLGLSNQELEKVNKFYDASIKRLQLEIKNQNIKEDAQHIEHLNLEEDLQIYKESAKEEIQKLMTSNELLKQKSVVEIEVLSGEIERLKKIIQDAVVKEIRAEEIKQQMQLEIGNLKEMISEMSSQARKKEIIMLNIREEINLEIQKQKLCDEEYSTLLEQFEEEAKKLVRLRGGYAQLEIMLSKAEEFITKLEERMRDEKEIFENKIEEKNNKIYQLNQEYNETMRGQIEKDLQYRSSIAQFQSHVQKVDFEKELLSKNLEALEAEKDANIEEFNRKMTQFLQINQNLHEELEHQKAIRDPKKRYKRQGTLDGKNLANITSRTPTALNRSKMSTSAFQNSKSQLHTSSDIDQNFPISPMGQEQNSCLKKDSNNNDPNEPNSPKFNQSPIGDQDEFKVTVIDAEGRVGKVFEIESPKKERRIEFPATQNIQKPTDSDENLEINSEMAQEEEFGSYEKLKEQAQKQKIDMEKLKIEIEQKRRLIIDCQNSLSLIQSELEEVKKNLQIAVKKRKQRFQYQELLDIESYFDYYNRENVGGIAVDMFREIQMMVKQLNYVEEQFLKSQKKIEQYASSIEEMEKQIERLGFENQILKQEIRVNDKAQKLDQINQEFKKQLEMKSILIESYETALQDNTQERSHSTRVLVDLQSENNHLEKTIESLQQTLLSLSQDLTNKQKSIQSLTNDKKSLEDRLETSNKKIEELLTQLDIKMKQNDKQLLQKKHEIRNLESRYHERGKAIEESQQEYQNYVKEIESMGKKLQELDQKYNERSKRFEELLSQSSSLTNANALLELQMKEMIQSKHQQERKHESQLNNQQSLAKKLKEQLLGLKKESIDHEQTIIHLKECIEDKQVNIKELKNDIEIFHGQIFKMNIEYEMQIKENQERKHKFQASQSLLQLEQSQLKITVAELKDRLELQKKMNIEHTGQIIELKNFDKVREQSIIKLESRYKEKIECLEEESRKLKIQTNNKIAANKKQIVEESNANLESVNKQLREVKKRLDLNKKEVEIERLEMFAKERDFEDTKADYEEQKGEYMTKIQRYENQVNQIAFKLKDYEINKPTVELYEEIVFQNQILKNRIAQLEGNLIFNKDSYMEKQIELEKAKREQNKRQFTIEIDHYIKQIALLQERNYELQEELQNQKEGDIAELQEQNERLLKNIARLEHSQEKLQMQVKILKERREEEYRKLSLQIRQLKGQKKEDTNCP